MKAKPDCAPITVAIDLGPERSGVALKERRYEGVGHQRYGFVVVAAGTVPNDEMVRDLKAARPRYVLVEKAAEGYRQAEARRALAQVEGAVDRSAQTVRVASWAEWMSEACGSSRTLKVVAEDRAMGVLARWLGDEEAADLWRQTAGNANRNARSALMMLALWEPKEVLLARGRWGPRVVFSKRTHGKASVRGRSAGAARLYSMLWLAGSMQARPGRALLCKAAGVSTKSYDRYIDELSEADALQQVREDGKLARIVL